MYTKKSAFFFINIFFITLFSFIAHLAIAQEETGASLESEEAVVSEPQGERPQIMPNTQALSTQIQTRITNLAANVSNRMEAAISRLDAIAMRIESRAVKLQSAGYANENVLYFVAQAQISLEAARNGLSDIDSQVHTTVSSEKPQEEWRNLRQSFTEVKDDLIAAKESLRQAVAEMKSVVEGNGVSEAVESTTEEEAEVTTE